MGHAIELRPVPGRFGWATNRALETLSFTIAASDFVAIVVVGQSGNGKSTASRPGKVEYLQLNQ